jgi:predicted RNA-binding Zn ribbon-like protein
VAPTSTRPHRGEPLALDLLNTTWAAEGVAVDWFAGSTDNVQAWLDEHRLEGRADDAVRDALVETREAIRQVLTAGDHESLARLNRVLAHASVQLAVAEGPRSVREVRADSPSWRPAVLAAANLLDLLDTAPDRIRLCEHERCVLWFLDTSRNGSRRWHSMAVCGNRAKASRHYARSRDRQPGHGPESATPS